MTVIPSENILKYINEARNNPSAFANYLKIEIETFLNEWELPLRQGCNYRTNQSKKAWMQACEFLTKQKPLKAYKLNQGLNLAADDHAIDLIQNNFLEHNSSNGDHFSKRIEKRCGRVYGSSGQNIGFDFKVQGRNHALQTVLALIIDDGVIGRGHRGNIFSPVFTTIGCSTRVQDEKIITVIDFHSADPPIVNGSPNGSSAGTTIDYPQQFPQPRGEDKRERGRRRGRGNGRGFGREMDEERRGDFERDEEDEDKGKGFGGNHGYGGKGDQGENDEDVEEEVEELKRRFKKFKKFGLEGLDGLDGMDGLDGQSELGGMGGFGGLSGLKGLRGLKGLKGSKGLKGKRRFGGDEEGDQNPQIPGPNFPKGFGGQGGGSNDGNRRIVSKSTSTKTQVVNGVRTTIKVIKIKYSDGTEDEQRQQIVG